jgi:hypothetical protein
MTKTGDATSTVGLRSLLPLASSKLLWDAPTGLSLSSTPQLAQELEVARKLQTHRRAFHPHFFKR